MKTICLIPARFHSSRFPGKLLKKALGKTVLQRTFENARRCKAFDQVYVATDHEEIAEHIKSLDGEVIWTSPSCKNGTERLVEAIQNTPHLQEAEAVLNVQGDHPCTSPDAMEAVLSLLKSDPNAAMATAACPLTSQRHFLSPHIVKCVFDQHQNALYFSRAPIPYTRNGMPKNAYHHIGLYAYRMNLLLSPFFHHTLTPLQEMEDLEQLNLLEKGLRIKVALVKDHPLGVDTPRDLSRLKAHLRACLTAIT